MLQATRDKADLGAGKSCGEATSCSVLGPGRSMSGGHGLLAPSALRLAALRAVVSGAPFGLLVGALEGALGRALVLHAALD